MDMLMQKIPFHLAIVTIQVFLLCHETECCSGEGCPCPHEENEFCFNVNNTNQYVKITCSQRFFCCVPKMKEGTTLLWYFNGKPFPFDENIELRDNNKMLLIHEMVDMKGSVKCQADFNQTESYIQVFNLSDISCLTKQATVIQVKTVEYAVVGDFVQLICNGTFGCDFSDKKQIYWIVNQTGKVKNAKYKVTSIATDGNKISSRLTINSIETEDFATTFICIANSSDGSSSRQEVKIVRRPQKLITVLVTNYLYLMFLIGFLVFVLIIVVTAYRKKSAVIFARSRIKLLNRFPSKILSDTVCKDYDVLLLFDNDNNDADRHFGNQICQYLKDGGYSVLNPVEAIGRIENTLENAKVAKSIVVLLSDNDHHRREMEQIIQGVVRNETDIKIPLCHVTVVKSRSGQKLKFTEFSYLNCLYHLDGNKDYRTLLTSLTRRIPK